MRRDLSMNLPKPIGFVFSGGANLGAVQVGMLRALQATGIYPDLVVGSSVGALNAAVVANHGMTKGIEILEKILLASSAIPASIRPYRRDCRPDHRRFS